LKATAIQVAISEILEPQLGVTEQVLAVHRLIKLDGEFVPLDVHENSEAGKHFIYFAIEDEPYYFVIVVEKRKEGFACSASYIEAEVRVYLCITSLTLDPEMISQRIGLTPTRSRMIGEPQHPKTPYLKVKEHRWYLEPQKDLPRSLEDKLAYLLDRLEPMQLRVAQLQGECKIFICICYKGYRSWMGGWHLDQESIRRIAALNAEIDLDLYAYGENKLPL
jgi:Domain of unknown function (DUF4279)